jgi:hypothetical protein
VRNLLLRIIFLFRGCLAIALSDHAIDRTLAAGRTLEAGANFSQIKAQLSHGTAKSVAVHTEFLGSFALVSAIGYQDFAEVLTLELAHGFFIANAAGVHLRHQAVQFSSHASLWLGLVND